MPCKITTLTHTLTHIHPYTNSHLSTHTHCLIRYTPVFLPHQPYTHTNIHPNTYTYTLTPIISFVTRLFFSHMSHTLTPTFTYTHPYSPPHYSHPFSHTLHHSYTHLFYSTVHSFPLKLIPSYISFIDNYPTTAHTYAYDWRFPFPA